MRVLLTNDDSLSCANLARFYAYLRDRHPENEYLVAAPAADQSGGSTSVTVRADVRFDYADEGEYYRSGRVVLQAARSGVVQVCGTPADCVNFGVGVFGPDLVLSGPNTEYNVGRCILYSGTVGAAKVAFANGVRAAAISFEGRFAGEHMPQVMARILGGRERCIMNFNVPASCTGEVVQCQTCTSRDLIRPNVVERGGRLFNEARYAPFGDLKCDELCDCRVLARGGIALSYLRPFSQIDAQPDVAGLGGAGE